MSPLRKELEKHLKEMCQEMGFKKNRSSYYVKQVNEDTYGTLFFLNDFEKRTYLSVILGRSLVQAIGRDLRQIR